MRTPEKKKSSVGKMLDILKNQEKKEKKEVRGPKRNVKMVIFH